MEKEEEYFTSRKETLWLMYFEWDRLVTIYCFPYYRKNTTGYSHFATPSVVYNKERSCVCVRENLYCTYCMNYQRSICLYQHLSTTIHVEFPIVSPFCSLRLFLLWQQQLNNKKNTHWNHVEKKAFTNRFHHLMNHIAVKCMCVDEKLPFLWLL